MSRTGLLLAPLVAGLLAGSVASAQTPAPQTPAAQTPATQTPAAQAPAAKAPAASRAKTTTARGKSAKPPSRYRPDRFAGRAGSYYRLVWGVDLLAVKWAESGEVLRFTYRVLDPNKAKALNDKKNEPVLTDPQAGANLALPPLQNLSP